MKKFILVALTILTSYFVFSQEIANADFDFQELENINRDEKVNNNDIKSIVFENTIAVKNEEWPDCNSPQNLYFTSNNGKNIRLKWDDDLDEDSRYRVKFKLKEDKYWVYKEQTVKYFDLPVGLFSKDIDIKVQRVCEINGERVESEWSESYLVNSLSIDIGCNDAAEPTYCSEKKSMLDDNTNDYYILYNLISDENGEGCVYFEWNFPFSNPNSLWKLEIRIGDHIGKVIYIEDYCDESSYGSNTGSFTYTLESGDVDLINEKTFCYFSEVDYGWCVYDIHTFEDYGMEPSVLTCSNMDCNDSADPTYCTEKNSILDDNSNDYYVLYNLISDENGKGCMYFEWNFPFSNSNSLWWLKIWIGDHDGKYIYIEDYCDESSYGSNSGSFTYTLESGDVDLINEEINCNFSEVDYGWCVYVIPTFEDYGIESPVLSCASPCSIVDNVHANKTDENIEVTLKNITQDELDALMEGLNNYYLYLSLYDGEDGNGGTLLQEYAIDLMQIVDVESWSYLIDLTGFESDDYHLYAQAYADYSNGDSDYCNDNIRDVPLDNTEDLYCSILSIMRGQFIDDNLVFTFNDDTYLENELNEMGLTIAEASAILTEMDEVDIQINYTYTENGVKKSGYSHKFVDGSTFANMSTWMTEFESISQEDFEGTIHFVVTDMDYSEDDIICDSQNISFNNSTISEVCYVLTNVEAKAVESDVIFTIPDLSQQDYNDFVDNYDKVEIKVDISHIDASNNVNFIKSATGILPKANTDPISLWEMVVGEIEINGIPAQNLSLKIEGNILATRPDGEIDDCSDFNMVFTVNSDSDFDLPEFSCGEPFTYDPPANQVELQILEVGAVIYSYGFPVKITKITETGEGKHSGEAMIPLPFKKSKLNVSFSNIVVNAEFQVLNGDFVGIKDQLVDAYPSTVPGSVDIGGDICIPPPPPKGEDADGFDPVTGLDAYGFDKNGNHKDTGTKYDPNGFDKNGNFINGGNHTPDGCTRDSVNYITGEKCDPGAWKNSDSTTFADSKDGSLSTDIDKIILELKNDYQNELTLKSQECNNIRTTMQTLIDNNNLDYDSKYIFGEQNEYLNQGMSKNFKQKPKALGVNFGGDVTRNPKTIQLEKKHVELYDCDVVETELVDLLAVINGLSPADKENFKTAIKQKLSFLDSDTVAEFNADESKYNEWLKKEVEELIKNFNSGYSFNYKRYKKIGNGFPIDNSVDYYNTIASVDDGFYDRSSTDKKKEIEFLFNQGFTEINGISRGVYLYDIAKRRMTASPPPGGGQRNDRLLPLVVANNGIGSDVKYWVLLDNIVIHHNEPASMDVYLVLENIDDEGENIVFQSPNVRFTRVGLTSANGEGQIKLGTDIKIRINNNLRLILPATDNYVKWNCDGFQEFNLVGQVEVCPNYIKPLNDDYSPKDPEDKFKFDISCNFTEWLQTVIKISAPTKFAVAGYEEIKWGVDNITIDLSHKTSKSFSLPVDYTGASTTNGNTGISISKEWRGIYMEGLTARLPDSWSIHQGKNISVEVEKAIIDGDGFTGIMSMLNVLSIDDGSMGGWPFSITDLNIVFVKNHIRGGGFGGKLNIPVTSKNDLLDYEATMLPDNHYILSVTPPANKVKFDMFLAEVKLDKNCIVQAEYKNSEFTAKAVLNGDLTVLPSLVENNDTAGFKLKLPAVHFDGFEVGTGHDGLYFTAGTWKVASTIGGSYNGFGVNLSNIGLYNWTDPDSSTPEEGNIALNFDMKMELKVSDKTNLMATGGFGIKGLKTVVDERVHWDYAGLDFRKMHVSGSCPGVEKIDGYLYKYNGNPNYGNGFRGALEVKFKGIGASLSAVGQFGDMGGYDYFFVDVLANLGLEAPLIPGVLNINGFGGGLSYHMDRAFDYSSINIESGIMTPPEGIGQSFSGVSYTPNSSKGLGLQASLLIATSKKEAFNGSVSLGFQFYDTGGVDKIQMYGMGNFMNIPVNNIGKLGSVNIKNNKVANKTKPNIGGMVTTYFNLELDFPDSDNEGYVFTGGLNMFMRANLAGGLIKLEGDGLSSLYFSKDKWYIYIGTPVGSEPGPIDIKANIGNIISSNIKSYIDIGTSLPPFPGVSENVRSIVGNLNLNSSLRNSGAGFMFGGSFNTKATLNAVIAKATMEAEVGFDLMLRHYENTHCSGQSDIVGINGWYASGQMWAYLAGELKILGFTVFRAGVATLFQAQMPNPFWMRASFGIKYKNIWGRSKSRKVTVELGEKCIMVGSADSQLGFTVIGNTEPADTLNAVPINTVPQIYFNVPLNEEFEITMGTTQKKFEAKNFTAILKYADNNEIPLRINTEDPYCYKIEALTMLPPNDTIVLELNIDVYIDGTLDPNYSESRVIQFVTSGNLNYIPESNIAAAYPFNGMLNFYRNEYNEHIGFIDLEMGQPYLFNQSNSLNTIRLTSEGGNVQTIPFVYKYLENRIEYDLDPDMLEPNTIYKLELLSEPNQQDAKPKPETVLYTQYFRVSTYETVIEKVNSIVSGTSSSTGLPPYKRTNGYTVLQRGVPASEPFGKIEMLGNDKYDQLLSFRADLNSNSWFSTYKKYMYNPFPKDVDYIKIDSIRFSGDIESVLNEVSISGDMVETNIDNTTFNTGISLNSIEQSIKFHPTVRVNEDYMSMKKEIIKFNSKMVQEATSMCAGKCEDPNSRQCKACMRLSESILLQDDTDINNFNTNLNSFIDLPTNTIYRVYVIYKLPDGTTNTYTTVDFAY